MLYNGLKEVKDQHQRDVAELRRELEALREVQRGNGDAARPDWRDERIQSLERETEELRRELAKRLA